MNQVMDMLYKYKERFSLRDEVGTCPNIKVEIDVTDKSPFFVDLIISKKRYKFHRHRNEKITAFRNIKGRILS